MLSINNLEVGYGGATVLRNVGIKVETGQVVCIMGRNGVGKTTLLKTVMGLLRPTQGEISFDGQNITRAAPDRRARAGIGFVPQGREIFPHLTVQENLELGLEAAVKGKSKPTKVPDSIFEMFPALKGMIARRGGQLSGGQQQQLAIGRALATDPSLLLLDEPMEGIQPSVVQEIEHAIRTIKAERKIAVLLVEQSLEFATTIADYTYIMDNHTVVAQGKPGEISEEVLRHHLTV
ncbi:high-affinity branched-chain amino acid transport ATP-binding protein LivF [Abditibacteriota bacterium]|nr:high-affinity branched-chain amino acid transport ATP-binding protein LivF [Abditibacteriota bacterium]